MHFNLVLLKTMKTLILSCIAILSLLSTPALAQLNLDNDEQGAVIELNPADPQPGEEVEATLRDFRGVSYGADIIWTIDDEVVDGARNKRSITFTAGTVGERQVVNVIQAKQNGVKEVITKFLVPVYLDLIIEPQTRVPDFYLGRSLPSVGSIVNVTALVSVPEILGTNMIYTWKLDQKVLEGGPVRGRNHISFATPRGRKSILHVSISGQDGNIVASRAILIPSVKPKLFFYEVNPLYGIKLKSIAKSFNMTGTTAVIKAEPYYLDSRVYNDPDIKEWKIDRLTSTTNNNPYEVTIQKLKESGSSILQFHVRDTENQVLQGDRESITIKF